MGRRVVRQQQRAALRAACSMRRAAGAMWRAAGGGSNNRDGNAQAAAACSNVRLFSSCGDSDVIQYLIFDLAFFVPGALETVREKKQDLKMTSG
jgi:hypothetical protein